MYIVEFKKNRLTAPLKIGISFFGHSITDIN